MVDSVEGAGIIDLSDSLSRFPNSESVSKRRFYDSLQFNRGHYAWESAVRVREVSVPSRKRKNEPKTVAFSFRWRIFQTTGPGSEPSSMENSLIWPERDRERKKKTINLASSPTSGGRCDGECP